jgi:hypothetical protein
LNIHFGRAQSAIRTNALVLGPQDDLQRHPLQAASPIGPLEAAIAVKQD